MRAVGLTLVALSLVGTTTEAAGLYYIEPWTATPDIENVTDKRAVADNIIKRVHIFCGDRLTDNRSEAAGTVHLRITYLKKVGGGARFLLGPFRGNSHVKIEMSVVDQEGQEIRRDLHRKGDGILGSLTFGVSDNKMLSRVARDVCAGLPDRVESPARNVQGISSAQTGEGIMDDQIVIDFRNAHEELKAAKASGDTSRIEQAEQRMTEVRARIQEQQKPVETYKDSK
jgi:hypothetical protein